MRSGLIDRSVVRDHEKYLYVPGSTIKGMVRELCEQLARFYEDISPEFIVSPHIAEAALQDLGPLPTMISRIFGSQARPGLLYFDDARLSKQDQAEYDYKDPDSRRGDEKGRYQNLQVDVYTQVRLDRPRRTAVAGALYSSEFGTRSMRFEGSIIGSLECLPIDAEADEFFQKEEDAPTYSFLLLLAGLSLLERLGGNKSTGKGLLRYRAEDQPEQGGCQIEQVTYRDQEIKPEVWQNWLHHLSAISWYTYMQSEAVPEVEI